MLLQHCSLIAFPPLSCLWFHFYLNLQGRSIQTNIISPAFSDKLNCFFLCVPIALCLRISIAFQSHCHNLGSWFIRCPFISLSSPFIQMRKLSELRTCAPSWIFSFPYINLLTLLPSKSIIFTSNPPYSSCIIIRSVSIFLFFTIVSAPPRQKSGIILF